MSDPLHICHIITRFIRGGADENTLLTCNGQIADGHRVTLICGAEYDESIRNELDDKVTFICEPSLVRSISPVNEIKAYQALKRWLTQHKPDIVHTHESKAGILGRLAARHAHIGCIIHGVHILAFMSASKPVALLYTLLERYCGSFTDGFIHVSDAMKQACQLRHIGDDAYHIVVPSGMQLDRYRHAAPPDLAKHPLWHSGLPQYPKILLMSGTLEPRKRVKEFLSVFALIVDAVPQAVLAVAGDGSQRGAIEREIAQLNLQNNVVLLGYSTELPQWIAAARLGIHAAEHEGLPRVIMQYIAGGKPVVACRLAGLEAIIDDRHNGIIVDSPKDMAAPVIELLLDDERYAGFQQAAQSTDVSRWSHDAMVRNIDLAYRHCLQDASLL